VIDERRSARLLFASELERDEVAAEDLERPEVEDAVRSRPLPSLPRRALQRLAMKRGRLTYERDCVAPLVRARRAVLGDGAEGPPRFLVRVDEFPRYQAADHPDKYGVEAFERFHAVMAEAGVPYLVAALPRVPTRPLDPAATGDRPLEPGEIEMFRRLEADGVSFGLHGYDHRTRHERPRRHSELCGLEADELRERLERGAQELSQAGVRPRVFVPPYNRFDAEQYPLLADLHDVVCGGPESVALLGFHRTPLWRGDAVYMPAYEPLYDHAAAVLPAAERMIESGAAVWAPIALHWSWESDGGLSDLKRLAERIAPFASPWDRFLEAVHDSAGR